MKMVLSSWDNTVSLRADIFRRIAPNERCVVGTAIDIICTLAGQFTARKVVHYAGKKLGIAHDTIIRTAPGDVASLIGSRIARSATVRPAVGDHTIKNMKRCVNFTGGISIHTSSSLGSFIPCARSIGISVAQCKPLHTSPC